MSISDILHDLDSLLGNMDLSHLTHRDALTLREIRELILSQQAIKAFKGGRNGEMRTVGNQWAQLLDDQLEFADRVDSWRNGSGKGPERWVFDIFSQIFPLLGFGVASTSSEFISFGFSDFENQRQDLRDFNPLREFVTKTLDPLDPVESPEDLRAGLVSRMKLPAETRAFFVAAPPSGVVFLFFVRTKDEETLRLFFTSAVFKGFAEGLLIKSAKILLNSNGGRRLSRRVATALFFHAENLARLKGITRGVGLDPSAQIDTAANSEFRARAKQLLTRRRGGAAPACLRLRIDSAGLIEAIESRAPPSGLLVESLRFRRGMKLEEVVGNAEVRAAVVTLANDAAVERLALCRGKRKWRGGVVEVTPACVQTRGIASVFEVAIRRDEPSKPVSGPKLDDPSAVDVVDSTPLTASGRESNTLVAADELDEAIEAYARKVGEVVARLVSPELDSAQTPDELDDLLAEFASPARRLRRATAFGTPLFVAEAPSPVSPGSRLMRPRTEIFDEILRVFNGLGLVSHYQIPLPTFRKFLKSAETQFSRQASPFHSFARASRGLSTVFIALSNPRVSSLFSPSFLAAVAVGALLHDLGHPISSNSIEVASASPLALAYNDHAPLQNNAASAVAKLLSASETNIFSSMEPLEFLKFREVLIDIIMNTNSEKHFELVKRLEARLSKDNKLENFSEDIDPEGLMLISGCLVHFSDIAGWTEPIDIAQEISDSLKNHREIIGMKCEELGIAKPADVTVEDELIFIKTILRPLCETLHHVFDRAFDGRLKTLDANYSILKDRLIREQQNMANTISSNDI